MQNDDSKYYRKFRKDLDEKYHDYALMGKYKEFRECHVQLAFDLLQRQAEIDTNSSTNRNT